MNDRIARLELEVIRLHHEIGMLKIKNIGNAATSLAAYFALSIAVIGVLVGTMAVGFGWT